MRHLTWRDAVATVLVAATLAAYLGWVARGSMPLIHTAADVAAVGFIASFAACLIGARPDAMALRSAALGGVGLVGLGVAALVSENRAVLAVFVGLIVVMWAAATLRHARVGLHGAHGGPDRTSSGSHRALT